MLNPSSVVANMIFYIISLLKFILGVLKSAMDQQPIQQRGGGGGELAMLLVTSHYRNWVLSTCGCGWGGHNGS